MKIFAVKYATLAVAKRKPEKALSKLSLTKFNRPFTYQ